MKTTKAFLLTSICCASAQAATIVTSYSTVTGADDNNQAGPNFGQSITVNVGADTDDASIPSGVYLTSISFQTSGSGSGAGSDAAYIHVYDAFAVDGSNNPSTIGNLVAVSTNTVDLANVGNNEQVTWNFSGLDLVDKGTSYAFVLAVDTVAAEVGASDNLTSGAFELDTGNPYTAGQTFRTNGTTTDWDMAFELTTSTEAIPEPSVAILGSIGLAGLMLRRRR